LAMAGLKILVCVKAVPDPSSSIKPDESGRWIEEDNIVWKVNEYDFYAMEEAVRTKEAAPGTEITVVSVGPPRVEEQVRKAMSMGAEHGLVIDDPEAQPPGPDSVSSIIAAWADDKEFDLVLCGVMSEDMQNCAVGPMLAVKLGMPWATTAIKLEPDSESGTAIVERELEGGEREKIKLKLPALVTVQSGINEPRYASLSNVLRVKAMEIPHVSASELGTGTKVGLDYSLIEPERTSKCLFLQGSPEEVAKELAEEIKKRVNIG